MRHHRSTLALVPAILALAACSPEAEDRLPLDAALARTGTVTAQPAQVQALLPQVTLKPIITTGDPFPGAPAVAAEDQAWGPLPDGLGGYLGTDGNLVLYANHELDGRGIPLSDGSAPYKWARVSRLLLDRKSLSVLEGSYAIDQAKAGQGLFERLCSAFWAGIQEGVGYPGIFLTGEESTNPGKGRQLAVDAAGTITEMPWFGLYAHENQVVIPGFEGRVVFIGLDDTAGASELYMYVAASLDAALAGQGKLYVLASSALTHAGNLKEGQTVPVTFREIENPMSLTTPAALQRRVDSIGALPFVRIEDGEADQAPGRRTPGLYFVDTGRSTTTGRVVPGLLNAICTDDGTTPRVCDPAGSIYRLTWADRRDPTRGGELKLIERSQGAATEWASPDNIATSPRGLMLQEDPAYPGFQRAPRIWYLGYDGTRGLKPALAVAEATNPGCDESIGGGAATCWETSGIIDASAWLGAGSWLFVTQAHGLPFTFNGASSTGESGQLLYLRLPGS